jgi:hypothetical protein
MVVTLTLLCTGVVLAAAPGSWTVTGSLMGPRVNGAAVLLPNNRVLLAGGFSNARFDVPNRSAEVYDPSSGTWTTTGMPLFPPELLTVLPNGKVLGLSGLGAELYDPASGTWSSAVNAPSPADAATLVPDGRVLIAGTVDQGDMQAALYNPATGSWTRTGTIPGPFGLAHPRALTLLSTGKVLLDSEDEIFGDVFAFLYEPAAGTWSATGSPDNIGRALSVLLPNGNLLKVGSSHLGGSSNLSSGPAEIYVAATGQWTTTASFVAFPDSLALLKDGHVLGGGASEVCGFCGPPYVTYFNSSELYDRVTGMWVAAGNLIEPQGQPYATTAVLRDGRVLIAGGALTDLRKSEIYNLPVSPPLPMSCALSLAGKDESGHAFIRVAVRDIASGLESVRVLDSKNATVAVPRFPSGSRDPAIVTATKIESTQIVYPHAERDQPRWYNHYVRPGVDNSRGELTPGFQ